MRFEKIVIVINNSFLSRLQEVLNDTYCMFSFTAGLESINYKLKKYIFKFIYISSCE